MKRILLAVLVVVAVLGGGLLLFIEPIRRAAVVHLSEPWTLDAPAAPGPTFDGSHAALAPLPVELAERITGLDQPTELVFVPGTRTTRSPSLTGTPRWSVFTFAPSLSMMPTFS